MKLPDLSNKLPFGQKKEELNYFLILTLGLEKASAIIIEENRTLAKVSGFKKTYFTKHLDDISDDELLTVLDKIISEAEKNLPENIQTKSSIFGVDFSWVENGKIKKDQLLRLKKISEELELTPVGFIVSAEAICHLLQKEEGAPTSAIIAQVGKDLLTATLVRGGRVIESRTSKLEGSPAETLDNLLKHFTNTEVLPSRIIVIGPENEKLSQEFVSFTWSKNLPFLHFPQTTSFDDTYDAKAVLYGAANQMKFSISDLSLKDSSENISDFSDFEEPENKNEVISKGASDEQFGFVQNSDVSDEMPKKTAADPKHFKEEIEEIPQELKINRAETKSLSTSAFFIFSGARKVLSNLAMNIRSPKGIKIPGGRGRGRLILIPGLIIIFLILISGYYFLFRSAIVTIDVRAQESSKEQDVIFSTSEPTDISSSTIRAEFIETSQDGKLTAPATGKKQTGEKAKGTVTVFNLSSTSRSFSAGTVIKSSNDLEFALDKSITVASQSGDATSPSPGKTDVSVTAKTFGTEYNLPSGTKFSLGDNSTSIVAAKNDNAFSGGTKKDIIVVSKEDQEKLSDKIIEELSDQAREEIQKKITGDKILIPGFINTSFDVKSFSKDVDDESKDLSITATITYQSIAYSKKDLTSFSEDLFKKDLGDDLTISVEDTQVEVDDLKKDDDDNISANLKIKTKIVPKIDQLTVAKKVQGKSFDDAGRELSDIPQKQNISIRVSPSIFFLPKILPNSPEKIKVMVNINE